MIQNLPWALAPAQTFVVYAAHGQALDVTNALSSLSVITLLTNSASKLLSAIPSTAAAVGCFDRIQACLLIPIGQPSQGTVADIVKHPHVRTRMSSESLVSLPLRNIVIVERLFGDNGLHRRLRWTVIFVTHGTEYVSYADQGLVLSNGNLRQKETHERKLCTPDPSFAAVDELDEEREHMKPAIKDSAAQVSQGNQINNLERVLEISLGSISRVRDFDPDVTHKDEGQKIKAPSDWPNRGAIEFSEVTAQYSPDAVALTDISFKAHPGQEIGICGRTGSSLLPTLLGMLDITRGSVVIDNIDLATMPRCTVRLNVDPAGQLSDTDMIATLDRVGLWKDVFKARGGLDAEIKDTLSLSRGQQQLLELGHATLRLRVSHAKFDSGVDVETDARMQETLRQAPCNTCTILTVAHRIRTIQDSDLVLVLDKGRVVGMDEPESLASRSGGIFASLLNSHSP
ncbi:P-loop containing nucleoside triphosphate hydrolase protein [Aspergillus ibericus CBS 121593]|uniref:P-loop containing nucleoside triphosphate hydrolase protein n=1 Tax=Aspergillus ibericus CBS 121593 TaxID=1448316 RepID=A0A395GUG3_9EURO|nr:P-loop containing nucleoside triphosphate hydrolase protein [Aspergillus ibericus CBS 121593]RAK98608.1 P-loop containing nucleoside triphosphate hydrolase protein [Aspergillus ibericus CBS 121593]